LSPAHSQDVDHERPRCRPREKRERSSFFRPFWSGCSRHRCQPRHGKRDGSETRSHRLHGRPRLPEHRAGEAAAEEINDTALGNAVALELDLSSLASVREFAAAFNERYSTLDVLVNNAAASLRAPEINADGFEMHWATNVLGPHLLTQLLLPALEASGHGRIVTVSTLAAGGLDLSDTQYERRRYSGLGAYRASKQATRMLTWALADRLDATRVAANALNPGYVLTELTTNVGGLMKALVLVTRFTAVTPREGADTAIWLAASPEAEGASGRFWNKRREKRCRFRDSEAANELWALVEQQLTAADSTRRDEPLMLRGIATGAVGG
jgi:NAD(P)-dependent dehydrogenase (short-subunit alcohol dehydrogenase family)